MRETIDIEAAVQAALAADGFDASAPPVPETLGSSLPHTCVECVGGREASVVTDESEVAFDVYAATDAEAAQEACSLTGWVRDLEGRMLGGVPCYASRVTARPYRNPDPRHQTAARYTFKATMTTRMA